MSQLILALVFSSTAHLLFDNILPLQISLLKQNLQGSQAEKSEAHQSALQKLEARRLDLMQQLELLIFAFSSTALLVFDNILTLQMSQSLAHQIPDKWSSCC